MFVEQRKTDADGNKVLVTVNKEDDLTPEVVARHMFLLDTAQPLGWEPLSLWRHLQPVFAAINRYSNSSTVKSKRWAIASWHRSICYQLVSTNQNAAHTMRRLNN